jgi:hypothetical protein
VGVGTWIGFPDEAVCPKLEEMLSLLTARAVGEADEGKREKLDLACLHLSRTIQRLREADEWRSA